MNKRSLSKQVLILVLVAVTFFATGVLMGKGSVDKPSSVIHVVTVDWATTATEEDVERALKGVETLANEYDGITRVWLRSIKSQTKDAAFVMEFEDEQALIDYAGTDAQQKWYEVYLPARGTSITHDITN